MELTDLSTISDSNLMNRYIKTAAALLGAIALAACSSDAPGLGGTPGKGETREITVNMSQLTRTTIEYENVDLSHLVWCDGDKVAYVSDAEGDVCRVATVSHNAFSASVPASATSGTLHIVYPVGDNEGKTLAAMRASVASKACQSLDSPFDGATLPMTARAAITEEATVDAEFEFPASVIRFRLKVADSHDPDETIESVSLSAAEDMAGRYSFSGGEWRFAGESKSIETTFAGGTSGLVAMQENGCYVYVVANRGKYTDVDLLIKTSAGVYRFEDGAMDLSKPGKTMYHVDLTLSEAEPVPQPRYRKITSLEELTAGPEDSYLVVCEGKKLLFCEYSGNNCHPGVAVSIMPDGIDPEDEAVKKRTCVIAPAGDSFPGLYSLHFKDITYKGTYLRCMLNFSSTPGKLTFDTTLDEQRDYWGISFDDDGNVLLKANPHTQDIAGDVFLGFNLSNSTYPNTFCTCGPDAKSGTVMPVQLYKLMK